MATKKKAAPQPKAKARPAPPANAAPPMKPAPPPAAGGGLGARVASHMAGHGHEGDPWSNMNAGGICGLCGLKLA